MSNSKRGYEVTVPLIDGTAKLIRYGANELALVEDHAGIKSVIALLQDRQRLMETLGMKTLIVFVWAGLRGARGDGGPEWTIEQVGRLLDLRRLGDYYDAVGNALRLALGGSIDDTKEAPRGDEDPTKSPASQPAPGVGTT